MKKCWSCLLGIWLILNIGCAAAAEVFVIAADQLRSELIENKEYAERVLSAPTQYIQITCHIEEEPVPVWLTILRCDDDKVVHQKFYGHHSGRFISDEIYLKYTGGTTEYKIILTAGDRKWQIPFYRRQMKLTHNTACSYGVRIREAAPGVTKGWGMATVVDISKGSLTVPLCASDQYVIGKVDILTEGDALWVEILPLEDIELTVHKQKIYAVTDPQTLTGLDESALENQFSFEPGQRVTVSRDLKGNQYVILYLAMEVSYDPNGLEHFFYPTTVSSEQHRMWEKLMEESKTETIG